MAEPVGIRPLPFAILLLLLGASSVAAQGCNLRQHGEEEDRCAAPLPADNVRQHLNIVAANAGIGAVTAGLSSYLKGGSFWKGALGGAAGGILGYAGKRIVTSDVAGSGLVGRQVAAIGSSAVLNASRGRGLFEHVILPLGPVRLDVAVDDGVRVHPRVDVASLIATAVIAAQPQVELSWRYTLSTGAAVFIDREPEPWSGRHTAGVITVKHRAAVTGADRSTMEQVIRHERVHLLQSDFTSIAWARPIESWVLSGVQGGEAIHRFVTFRSDLAIWLLMNAALDHPDRPTEIEAYFLNQ